MTSRRFIAAAALTVPIAFALTVGQAFAAATGTGSTPTMTVSYTISDIQFDGPDCVNVPLTVDFSFNGAPQGYVVLDIAYAGSSSKVSTSVILVATTDGQSGTRLSEVAFCPAGYFPNRGPLQVTGTVTSPRVGGVTSALSASTVAVHRNPVRMSRVKVKWVPDFYTLSGTVVAKTVSKGLIGAAGIITIQLRKPGSTRWVSGATAVPDQFGAWSSPAINSTFYPSGTRFRALLRDCRWCADATSGGVLQR